ncbi:MAG: sigma-70 family RNA polymerase sigma factor [Pelobium sp.]
MKEVKRFLVSHDILENDHAMDDDLWMHFKAGDQRAFAKLYNMYANLVYNYASKFTANQELIEDCVHSLFLELWNSRENLSIPRSILFYFFSSIKRRLIREQSKQREVLIDLNEDEYLIKERYYSYEDMMIILINQKQQTYALNNGLINLSEKQRKVILLKYYKRLSVADIATNMNISSENVYKLLSRGISALRQSVKLIAIFFFPVCKSIVLIFCDFVD